MSENYEKVVSDLSMMIEQFPDIPNSLFSDDINWEKPTLVMINTQNRWP